MDKVQTAVVPPNYFVVADLQFLTIKIFLSLPFWFLDFITLCSIVDNSAHDFSTIFLGLSHENFLQSHTLDKTFAQRSRWNSFRPSNGLEVSNNNIGDGKNEKFSAVDNFPNRNSRSCCGLFLVVTILHSLVQTLQQKRD